MYYHFSILGLILVIYILYKVKNKLFSEVKSFLWVIGGMLVIILPVFPFLITDISKILGIDYPPSLLFLLSILFVIFVTFRQEQDMSTLNARVKDLAQRNALLEAKVRTMK